MHPFDYVEAETIRQAGSMKEAVGMYYAWTSFRNIYSSGFRLNRDHLLAAIKSIKGFNGHRKVPAVFNQGTPALPPGEQLERAMMRWYETLNSSQVDVASRNALFDTERAIADFMTREFLLIHPFADGNGRVASLVWNFLNGSIKNPETMPYFFGPKGL